MDIKFHCSESSNFQHGYKVRTVTYKEYFIEMHNHDFYEMNIVLSGRGTHCIEDRRFSARRGDVFVIPPMVAHAYTDAEHLEVYHILFQKGFLYENRQESDQMKGFTQLTEIEPFLRSNVENTFFLHLSNAQLHQMEMDREILDGDSAFPWEEFAPMKYHVAWKILYWFSALLYDQTQTMEKKQVNKYEVQIIKVLEYIHQNYGEKLSIDRLCAETYMSRASFFRSFKGICGMNPMEYVAQYRCQKAMELQDITDLSKTEIAHRCGFYDLSHMERVMKTTGKPYGQSIL